MSHINVRCVITGLFISVVGAAYSQQPKQPAPPQPNQPVPGKAVQPKANQPQVVPGQPQPVPGEAKAQSPAARPQATQPQSVQPSAGQRQGLPQELPGQPPRDRDAVAEAQTARRVEKKRPEQELDDHDRAERFDSKNATPASPVFKSQAKEGRISGFDFSRDPINADRPFTTLKEAMESESAARPKVMAAQRQLLESRYDLTPRPDKEVTMSRGKPVMVGPTAKLAQGMTFEALADMSSGEIRRQSLFPYPTLPHPLQVNGGQVFPAMQIEMFPRLARYDVEFDIPEAFLPEFPPAIFLQNRPELGDVSRGQVVSINNFRELFKDIMTPVQLDGMRLLLTPLAQEEFNTTDDRKSPEPTLGVACFDCHVNGHTTGQFHLTPDIRPQERRFRLDTVSLRGVFNQQIHGSKRSLRSVEDFTEFEQRTAYFNGDPIRAMKKGFQEIPRSSVPHMAQAQNMFDFPPAPKLTVLGRLDPEKATESELRGEKIFFGKGQCSVCHPAPFFLDHQMHDLHLERFLGDEPGDGPIKTFTLRGIKESPPYLHDGRCLTLEDTVEFFNLVLGTRLTKQEKADLAAFLKQL